MSKIDELDEFFKKIELPDTPIQLDKSTKIVGFKKFIETHIATLRANSGKRTFLPYYERLIKLKELIKNK